MRFNETPHKCTTYVFWDLQYVILYLIVYIICIAYNAIHFSNSSYCFLRLNHGFWVPEIGGAKGLFYPLISFKLLIFVDPL